MPLIPLVALPVTTSTAAEIRAVGTPTGQTVSVGFNIVYSPPAAYDHLIEAPIQFVPGLEAHPSREAVDEPAGSGPFGF